MTRTAIVAACVLFAVALGSAWWFARYTRTRHEVPAQIRELFWEQVYANGGETLYCGVPFQSRADFGGHLTMEHVVPRESLEALCVVPGRWCDRFKRAASDMHNLWPELDSANKARATYPFGEISGEDHRLTWLPNCPDLELEISSTGARIEPRDDVKGEIARSILHMEKTYGVSFSDRDMILRWHRTDPPSEVEHRRNDIINSLQHTRNSFIDGEGLGPAN